MASAGYTDVTASLLRDASGTPITNATAVFTPNLSFRTGGAQGQTALVPVSVPVTNGGLSTVLADTSISNPQNVSYGLVVTDNLSGDVVLAKGYEHLQPSGSSWSLDNYVTPIGGPLAVIVAGPQGIQGEPGIASLPQLAQLRTSTPANSGNLAPASGWVANWVDGNGNLQPGNQQFLLSPFIAANTGGQMTVNVIPTNSGLNFPFYDSTQTWIGCILVTAMQAGVPFNVPATAAFIRLAYDTEQNPLTSVNLYNGASAPVQYQSPTSYPSNIIDQKTAKLALTPSLAQAASLRAKTSRGNQFYTSDMVAGSFIDWSTGSLVPQAGTIATGFIPAAAGGAMRSSAAVDAVIKAVGNPYQSSTANLLSSDSTLFTQDTLININGTVESHAGYSESPYFMVAAGQTYTTNINLQGGQWGIVYYDANMNYLGGDQCAGHPNGENPRALISVTIPASYITVKYARFGLGGTVMPGSPETTYCPSVPAIIQGDATAWNNAYPNGACPPAFASSASATFHNGVAKYDADFNYLRGIIGPINANTDIACEADVAYVRMGFATDISTTLMIAPYALPTGGYQAAGTLAPNVIAQMIESANGTNVLLSDKWPAMKGLDWWITFGEGSGSASADQTGNGHNLAFTGTATTPATWLGPVGVAAGTQHLSVASGNGRMTYGFCAYFPVGGANPMFGGDAAGGYSSFRVQQSYGIPYDHWADAMFPCINPSNGGALTVGADGISGIHCIEVVLGDGSSINDQLFIDGKEVTYNIQGSTSDFLQAAHLSNAVYAAGGTFYSMWASTTRDTPAQATARCRSEMTRLASLGVRFGLPVSSTNTKDVVSITGTSIDVGFQASQAPASRLSLPFTADVVNGAISGQPPKDMRAGFEDREAPLYRKLALRNIAYHGGVTNGVMNLQESPANAVLDMVAWARLCRAQGWKTVAGTMLSRSGTGYNNLSGDVLAQQSNALLLQFADEFDWICNYAADPLLGATGACNSTTYFADGTHPNNTGQNRMMPIFQAGVVGVCGSPITVISGNYTQLDTDRSIVQAASANSTVQLKDASYQSFNHQGRLTVKNAGTGTVTISAISGQTIDSQSTITLAPGAYAVLAPYVANTAAGGAQWITV